MGTRVFVGGLSYRVRERDLERFFRKYGSVRGIAMKNGYAFVEFDDYRDADDAVYELNGKDLMGERIIVEHARGTDRARRSRDRFGGGGGGGGGGYNRRRWDRVSVERARGTPRGSDRWKERGGGGGGRPALPPRRRFRSRSPRRDRDRRGDDRSRPNSRYGPPTRTEYRVIVENLSSRVSWQDLKDFMRQAGEVTYADAHKNRRNEGVVEFISSSDMKTAMEKLDGSDLNGRKIRLVEDKGGRRRRSRSSSGSRSASRSRSRSSRSRRSRSRSRRSSRSRSKNRSKSASRSRSRSRSKSKSKNERRTKSRSRSRSKSPVKHDSRSRSRSRSRSAPRNGSAGKDRSRSRSVSKDKSKSKSRSPSVGKGGDQQD